MAQPRQPQDRAPVHAQHTRPSSAYAPNEKLKPTPCRTNIPGQNKRASQAWRIYWKLSEDHPLTTDTFKALEWLGEQLSKRLWKRSGAVSFKVTNVDSRQWAEERFLAAKQPKNIRGKATPKEASKTAPRFRTMGMTPHLPLMTKSSGVKPSQTCPHNLSQCANLGTTVLTAMSLEPDWIARSLVATFGMEGAPSFITSHEYEIERNCGAFAFAHKFQPITNDSTQAKAIGNEIKKNGLVIQAPRDSVVSIAQDSNIIQEAERIKEKAKKDPSAILTPEQLDVIYYAEALEAQRRLGQDADFARPMFQLVENIQLQSTDIARENNPYCTHPNGNPANISYFPRDFPDKDSWIIAIDPVTGDKKAERAEDAEQTGIRRFAIIRNLIKEQSEKNTRDTAMEAAGMMAKGTEAIIQKKARNEELANAKDLVKDLPSPDKRKAIEMARKMAPVVCESKIIFVNFPPLYTTSRRTGKKVAQTNEYNLDLHEHMTVADLYSLVAEKHSERFKLLETPTHANAEILIHLKTATSPSIRIYGEEAEDLEDVTTAHLGRSPTILIVADNGTEEVAAATARGTHRINHPSEPPLPEKKAQPSAAQEQMPGAEGEDPKIQELQQTIAELRKQQETSTRTARNKEKAVKIRHGKQLANVSRPSPDISSSISPSPYQQGGPQLVSPEYHGHAPGFITVAQIMEEQELLDAAAAAEKKAAEEAAAGEKRAEPLEDDASMLPPPADHQTEVPSGAPLSPHDTLALVQEPQGSPPKKARPDTAATQPSPLRSLAAKFDEVFAQASTQEPVPRTLEEGEEAMAIDSQGGEATEDPDAV